MIVLEGYQQRIASICRKYQVKSLRVFGSALTEDFSESSDIDFLIELNSTAGGITRYYECEV
ncbi:MAG: nucleotidyltransferase family protein [Candidatus Electrothrix sp. YB6]